MKLWLLERLDDVGWDEYVGFVVRAETEEQARTIAYEKAKSTGGGWLNQGQVRCEEVTADGPAEIILDSFNAG